MRKPVWRSATVFCVGFVAALGTAMGLMATGRDSAQGARGRAEEEIRGVLSAQTADWNRHDLDGFMKGYWRSPELTFYSGGNIAQGWDAAMARYQRNYQSAGKEMGTLEFADLSVEVTSTDSAWVMGKYQLTMSDGSKPHGIFTLIFRKIGGEWKIVHDHTSAGT
jgi:ketosteroid isomerase-like protein